MEILQVVFYEGRRMIMMLSFLSRTDLSLSSFFETFLMVSGLYHTSYSNISYVLGLRVLRLKIFYVSFGTDPTHTHINFLASEKTSLQGLQLKLSTRHVFSAGLVFHHSLFHKSPESDHAHLE